MYRLCKHHQKYVQEDDLMKLINIYTGEALTAEWFIALLGRIFTEIIAFVAKEEGWE